MANYTEFKTKEFDLKKDARAWAEKIKKQNVGQKMKIETNYIASTGRWEAVVLRKAE